MHKKLSLVGKGHVLTPAILTLIAIAYVLLFIPPNLTGTHDPNMLIITGAQDLNKLGIYNSDEYLQYQNLMGMLHRGSSFRETLHNILVYKHWQFGYPFFLSSAIAILPLKVVLKYIDGINSTAAFMLILRQLSPFFMVIAIMLLIYMWTGFNYPIRSILLFIFIGSVPAIIGNNLWWHPDSLVTLCVVLTIFCLYKDKFDFGKWFYSAAFFCGLATGTKVIGIYFFLTIATYILSGILTGRILFATLVKKAIIFCIIMVLTIVATNPLLLIPHYAKEIFECLEFHATTQKTGWRTEMTGGPLPWYAESLKHSFGYWWMYVFLLYCAIMGIIYDKEKRLLNILILTWIAPLSIYLLFFVVNKSGRYFIPVFLPLLSCAANPTIWNIQGSQLRKRIPSFVLIIGMALICLVQLRYYTKTNIDTYIYSLNKEKGSQSVAFYRDFYRQFLHTIPPDKHLTILRDYFVYIPPMSNLAVYTGLGIVMDDYVSYLKPDLVLLLRRRSSAQAVKLHEERVKRNHKFFNDAENNRIAGYHILLKTDEGIALEKDK